MQTPQITCRGLIADCQDSPLTLKLPMAPPVRRLSPKSFSAAMQRSSADQRFFGL